MVVSLVGLVNFGFQISITKEKEFYQRCNKIIKIPSFLIKGFENWNLKNKEHFGKKYLLI